MRCCNNICQLSFFHRQAILCHFIENIHIILQIIKIHIIVKNHLSVFLDIRHDSHRTIDIFIFQQSRMRCTIRIDQPVHTEIAIMNGFSMIPSIIISGLSIFCRSMCDRMITPLPDKPATHPVILMNHLKIIFKISRSVSHAVAVFYQQKRFASVIFQIILYLLQ